MLAQLGVPDLATLIREAVPPAIRTGRPLALPPALIANADPVLAEHLRSEEAEACFVKASGSLVRGGVQEHLGLLPMLAGYQALLCPSHCLYLTEPRKDAPDAQFAIANRLSHFLWNSRPDDELAQLAQQGRLHDKATLKAQTERLIADARFEQFVRTFAEEWLDLRKLRRDIPDERLYPEYRKDDYLVDSMEHETRAFLRALVRENLPASAVIAADFTFVNDRLAAHYDLPRVSGSAMQRVTLPKGSPFGGLITQAALGLFDKLWETGRPVRLLGVGVSALTDEVKQFTLWDLESPEFVQAEEAAYKQARLEETIRKLSRKYGDGTLRRGPGQNAQEE